MTRHAFRPCGPWLAKGTRGERKTAAYTEQAIRQIIPKPVVSDEGVDSFAATGLKSRIRGLHFSGPKNTYPAES